MVSEEEKKKLLDTVSDDIEDTSRSEGTKVATFVVFGFCAAVLVAVVIAFSAQKSKESAIESLDLSIQNEVTSQLNSLKTEQKQIATIQKQLGTLKTALDSRESFGKILGDFSGNTFKSARIKTLSIQQEEISLTGETDNYSDLAKVVSGYRKIASIEDVKLQSASFNQDSKKVEFSIALKIDRSKYILKKASASATATATPSL